MKLFDGYRLLARIFVSLQIDKMTIRKESYDKKKAIKKVVGCNKKWRHLRETKSFIEKDPIPNYYWFCYKSGVFCLLGWYRHYFDCQLILCPPPHAKLMSCFLHHKQFKLTFLFIVILSSSLIRRRRTREGAKKHQHRSMHETFQ